MTDKEALESVIGINLLYCESLYQIKNELKCINLCNSCEYKEDSEKNYPCYINRLVDKLTELIPQLDVNKLKEKKMLDNAQIQKNKKG